MNTCCVVAVNGSRARIMMMEDVLPKESGPELKEVETLLNVENLIPDRELWSDHENSNRGSDGSVHGYDDHRERHKREFNSHFARRIVSRVVALASENGAELIIILAESKVLGFIRKAWAKQSTCDIVIKDADKNVSRLTPYELHHYLAREGLLPERHAPSGWLRRVAS